MDHGERVELVRSLSAAFGDLAEEVDPGASIGWAELPTVGRLVAHVGGVQRWVAAVLTTGGPVVQAPDEPPAAADGGWYREGRAQLLTALAAADPHAPCWTLGGLRVAGAWSRRMVHEHLKHLIDLRAAGGGTWRVPVDIAPAVLADGVDELLEVFLPRSRAALPPLPSDVELRARDLPRRWRIAADWTALPADRNDPGAVVEADAGDLALLLWERADPLAGDGRFRITGSRAAVAALRDAPVHPW